MEELLEVSQALIRNAPAAFKRYLHDQIDWHNRLIGIKGARGCGKTTLLLQWIKQLELPGHEAAYFSLDELYFTTNTLVDTGKQFYQQGGKVLVLDEVHKYPSWSREIKNLHDRYEDLKIVFTGSSIIDIAKQEADLSRRAMMYELNGLSYREYLEFQYRYKLSPIALDKILDVNWDIRSFFPDNFKPLAFFKEYLQLGYYPFFANDPLGYYQRLKQLTRTIIEYDMAELKGFDIRHAKKLLQLLYVIAQQEPFKPNINNLSEKTGIHRNTVGNYLHFLHNARLIHLLYPGGPSISILQKPGKVYLNNTNLLYALSEDTPSTGTVREVFFNSQLNVNHQVNYSSRTDFEVDKKYHFEIGGKNKGRKQINTITHAWVVKDDIEYPVGQSLPLWIFGFLY